MGTGEAPGIGFAVDGNTVRRAAGLSHAYVDPAALSLDRQRGVWFPRQRAAEVGARADVELAEDLVEVVLDRTRADEQARADLGVREAVAGEPRDLGLPGGELAPRLDGDFTGGLAGGQELSSGALGESLGAHVGEHVVRSAQLLARVHPPALPAQPFAVGEMGAGEPRTDARGRE